MLWCPAVPPNCARRGHHSRNGPGPEWPPQCWDVICFYPGLDQSIFWLWLAVPSGLDRNGPGLEWLPQDSNSWWQKGYALVPSHTIELYQTGASQPEWVGGKVAFVGFELMVATRLLPLIVALMVPSELLCWDVICVYFLFWQAVPPGLDRNGPGPEWPP